MSENQTQAGSNTQESFSSLLDSIIDKGTREEYSKGILETRLEQTKFAHEYKLAEVFAKSGDFDGMKGKSTEQAIASAMAKIQMGKYWNINPADSMRFIRFDRGKPVLENEIIAAKLQEAGWSWDIEYSENEKGRCNGCTLWPKKFNTSTKQYEHLKTRDGKDVSVKFDEQDASRAMIWETDSSGSKQQKRLIDKWNFLSWPEDMYFTKCIARLKRRYAPGVLSGARTADEVGEEYEPTQSQDPSPKVENPQNPFTVQSNSDKPSEKLSATENDLSAKPLVPENTVVSPRGDASKSGPQLTREEMASASNAVAGPLFETAVDKSEDFLPDNLQPRGDPRPERVFIDPNASQVEQFASILSEAKRQKPTLDEAKDIKLPIQRFMAAFIGCGDIKKLKKPSDGNTPLIADYMDLFPVTMAIVSTGGFNDLLEDPSKHGQVLREGWNRIKAWMIKRGLSPREQAHIIHLVLSRYEGDGNAAMDWLELMGESKMKNVDVVALVDAFTITREAYRLKKISEATDSTVSELLSPLDLMKATEGDVLALLKKADELIAKGA